MTNSNYNLVKEIDEWNGFSRGIRLARLRGSISSTLSPVTMRNDVKKLLGQNNELREILNKLFYNELWKERAVDIIGYLGSNSGARRENIINDLYLMYIDKPKDWMKESCLQIIEPIINNLLISNIIKTSGEEKEKIELNGR